MTWLSRLLPQSLGLQKLADDNHVHLARQRKGRRRLVNLELLENRALLAGDVTVSSVVGGVLTITGDTHQDQFRILENGDSAVTVVGTPLGTTHTSINGLPLNTPVIRMGVTSINVFLSGPNGQSTDMVELAGPGKTSPTGIKNIAITVTGMPAVTVNVHDVDNSGTFSLNDGTSTVAGGMLKVNVTNSHFASLSIYQTGCCPAFVELDNDTVPGPVSVTEGLEQSSGIVLDGIPSSFDTFGPTTLTQGAVSPTMGGCNGDSDFIDVSDATLTNLTINQEDNGPAPAQGAFVAIGAESEVEVSLLSFGIVVNQGNGGGDTIIIESITTFGTPPLNNLHQGPDSIVTNQGNGKSDVAIVDSSFVYGNIESFQGNGAADFAGFFGDEALGASLQAGPFSFEVVGGLEEIVQGNGDNDIATLDCGLLENVGSANYALDVFISQGAAIYTPGCNQQVGDTINVNWTFVFSDMTLEQGENDEAGLDLGSNLINIATTSIVFVGDQTIIDELGVNNGQNNITLGGVTAPDSGTADFETGFLDIYTGFAGGSFVSVQNTLVLFGSAHVFSPLGYNIEGGGGDNTATIDSNSQDGLMAGQTTADWAPFFVPPVVGFNIDTVSVGVGVTADPFQFACC